LQGKSFQEIGTPLPIRAKLPHFYTTHSGADIGPPSNMAVQKCNLWGYHSNKGQNRHDRREVREPARPT
jgi:hypothetical protein